MNWLQRERREIEARDYFARTIADRRRFDEWERDKERAEEEIWEEDAGENAERS
jgi:hypothetical protein